MDGTGAWRWEAGRWLVANQKVSRYFGPRLVLLVSVANSLEGPHYVAAPNGKEGGTTASTGGKKAESEANEIKKMSAVGTEAQTKCIKRMVKVDMKSS